VLASIGFGGLGSGGGGDRLGGGAAVGRASGADGLRTGGRDDGGGATVVAEACRRSRLRRLEYGSGLSCVDFIVADCGSTLQVVVVISVPSSVIIKVSR
jgi:hypothetical protein